MYAERASGVGEIPKAEVELTGLRARAGAKAALDIWLSNRVTPYNKRWC